MSDDRTKADKAWEARQEAARYRIFNAATNAAEATDEADDEKYFAVLDQAGNAAEAAAAEITGPYVFTSERGTPFTTDALNRHIKRLAAKTKIGFPVHVHMLRHACGYALANKGHDTRSIQDYLGHKAIQHTVRYTELSPVKFKNFWRD